MIVGSTIVLIIDSIETKLISDQRYYYIAGGAIVLGIIAVCLFPLWPMEARQVMCDQSTCDANIFLTLICGVKFLFKF